ncbi:MAG: hypothetical protein K0R15_2044 [Clostridiales bacterium]|jgi:hypothetical protein|nr:hypothetical protein [Clostridiales bacterium]
MSQYLDHKKACEILKMIDLNPGNYLLIHYSCESFFDIRDGRTPRITSIAIRHLATGQTDSFSMHKTAEQMEINSEKIPDNYDLIEKEMLKEYFDFLKENKDKYFLHVNMRDINYGFKAIEHRFKVLKGLPYVLQDSQKIDFAHLLIRKFGNKYIGHPRMENLYKLNGIRPLFFLTGKEEAEAFEKHEYIKLHQSTLSKVDIYNNLLDRAIKGNLKTNAKWHQIYGINPQGIFEYCKSQWWIQLLWSISLLFLGALLGSLFS